MKNNPQFSETRINIIVWTLLALMPLVGMAVDLITPSLPAIAISLQIPAKIAKDVVSIYLLGYGLGNFLIGFLTDSFGRKKFLISCLLGFTAVSIIPVIFPKIEVLLTARLLQGITIGGIAVVTRAVVSDVLPPEKLIRLGVLIGMMWGLGPVIGPIIGGYLQYYFGWKAGFCFFAFISFLGLLVCYFIVPETSIIRHPLDTKTLKKNFLEILTHRLFMAMVVLMGAVYALVISFHTMAPFLIQEVLNYSPIFFGKMAFWFGLVFLVATFICRYLLKRIKVEQIFLVVVNLFFICSLIYLLLSFNFDKSLVLISLASASMFFVCGFLFPMSMGKGLSLFRHIAGSASAVMYLVNMLITSAAAFLISFIHIENAIPLMSIYSLLLFICVILYWFFIREKPI